MTTTTTCLPGCSGEHFTAETQINDGSTECITAGELIPTRGREPNSGEPIRARGCRLTGGPYGVERYILTGSDTELTTAQARAYARQLLKLADVLEADELGIDVNAL